MWKMKMDNLSIDKKPMYVKVSNIWPLGQGMGGTEGSSPNPSTPTSPVRPWILFPFTENWTNFMTWSLYKQSCEMFSSKTLSLIHWRKFQKTHFLFNMNSSLQINCINVQGSQKNALLDIVVTLEPWLICLIQNIFEI